MTSALIPRIGAVAAAAFGAVLVSSPVQAETLRLAHAVPTGHVYQELAEHLAARISEATGGEYEVRIFPNGQLGQEPSLAESLRSGNVDLAFFSSNSATAFVKPLGVFSLPYLFSDADHLSRVLNDSSFLETVDSIISEASPGFRRVAMLTSGVRNLYANTEVIGNVEDLAGTKIRVQPSPVEAQVWSTLGALPVSLPLGDIYTSMQTGLIQAYEGPIGTYYKGKMYEVAPYVALTEHQRSVNFLFISEQTWQELPAELQTEIMEIGSEFDELAAANVLANDAAFLKELQEKFGVTVGDADKASFQDKVAEMIRDSAAEIGAEDLVQKVQDAS